MSGKEKKMNNSSKFRNERNNENKKDEKSAQRDANTARAGSSKVRTPPAGCHKPTDMTDYNTLRRSAS